MGLILRVTHFLAGILEGNWFNFFTTLKTLIGNIAHIDFLACHLEEINSVWIQFRLDIDNYDDDDDSECSIMAVEYMWLYAEMQCNALIEIFIKLIPLE